MNRNDSHLKTSMHQHFWHSHIFSPFLGTIPIAYHEKWGFIMAEENLTGNNYEMCNNWNFFHVKLSWSKYTSVSQTGDGSSPLHVNMIPSVNSVSNPVILGATLISAISILSGDLLENTVMYGYLSLCDRSLILETVFRMFWSWKTEKKQNTS